MLPRSEHTLILRLQPFTGALAQLLPNGKPYGSTSGGSNNTTPHASKDSSSSSRLFGSGSQDGSFRKDPIPFCTTCFTYHRGKCRAGTRFHNLFRSSFSRILLRGKPVRGASGSRVQSNQ
ncbi:hypothetical protein DVH24_004772 [Malus domestica]|uniref:Uncharacterized protein n=1 Tax=Malus domestica TaxID=3750 RepID=A0A498IAS9_MALDO|nr:hypothetical protein DVH24_004772 [Malus domestica]